MCEGISQIQHSFVYLFASQAADQEPGAKSVPGLEEPARIELDMIEATVCQVLQPVDPVDYITQHMEEMATEISSSRCQKEFSCKLCSFKSKFKVVCTAHISQCLERRLHKIVILADESVSIDDTAPSQDEEDISPSGTSMTESGHGGTEDDDIKEDFYFNYKNAEFMLDSLFALSTVYESYGDGLGMYIMCKVLLPVFHGLRHSNYSCSIHRFITRILCDSTPKEAMKIMHERFFNRKGSIGGNIFKDRRMEHRIGTTKQLISNLGPNFDEKHVQQVNKTVEIKEQLYHETRKAHGVEIRSGRHNPRSDHPDYELIFQNLESTQAHIIVPGRSFGDFDLPKDFFCHSKFDKAGFFRWLSGKNSEAESVIEAT